MKNLAQHIQEKLQISRNRQYNYADDITVSNLIKLIYNYGPEFDIKDAFGRRKVKVLPTAEVNEKETEVLGKEIYKITFSGGAAWKNIPSFMTVWTWHAPQGKDSITCYEGEDEKLQSLFKPEILDEMFIFLKKHSRVQEKLQISRNKITKVEHTLFPKTKGELKEMIKSEIEKNGNNCSLNHIDVSKITDMGYLFLKSDFNGDISEWDVSNVTDMKYMFEYSAFDGDISDWDVSKVTDMRCMFSDSKFTGKNGGLNNWNVSHVITTAFMFYNTGFNGDISKWNVSKVTNTRSMFARSEFNCDISGWNVSRVFDMDDMFLECPLQNNPPKWYKE